MILRAVGDATENLETKCQEPFIAALTKYR